MKYFSTWSGYNHPIIPQEEISETEAVKKSAYYIAYYDEKGQIVKFEKHGENAVLIFTYLYEYYKNGVIKKAIIRNNKGEHILLFDVKGKYMSEKK